MKAVLLLDTMQSGSVRTHKMTTESVSTSALLQGSASSPDLIQETTNASALIQESESMSGMLSLGRVWVLTELQVSKGLESRDRT